MTNDRFEAERRRLSGLTRAGRFEELLTFPCRHQFKVIGKPASLCAGVSAVMARHHHPDAVMVERSSKGGKWLSISVEITAQSGKELDQIYASLEVLEGVKVLL